MAKKSGKSSSRKKMPSAPIKSPTSNIKGIGKQGPSYNNLSPLNVDPKFGNSAQVSRAIQKPPGSSN